MTESLRVFVNGTGVTVPAGSTVIDAVDSVDPAAAANVRAGKRAVTDSRGLPAEMDLPLSGGFVMRVVPVRTRATDPDGAE